jgi:hypothetical protein
MRENLTSGSRWQGMKTRQGSGTEALSQETESNGSATPTSRRHPLTLPPDALRARVMPVVRPLDTRVSNATPSMEPECEQQCTF